MDGPARQPLRRCDAETLRRADRSLKPPFQVQASSGGESAAFTAEGVLRHLPGKRLVCVGRWGDRSVVLKLFLDARRGSVHAAREARGLRACARAGLPAPEILFDGRVMPGGAPLLVLPRIPDSLDLLDVWNAQPSPALREALLEPVMDLVARMHEAGLTQSDLHLRNFLWTPAGLWVIDGAGVKGCGRGRPLARGASLNSLGLLFAQLPALADGRPEALLGRYLAGRGRRPDPGWERGLQRATRRQRRRREALVLGKVFRDCSAFLRRDTFRRVVICDRRYVAPGLEAAAGDPAGTVRGGRVLKRGNSSSVFRVDLDGRRLALKQYHIKSPMHALSRGWRAGRAARSWRNAQRLRFHGIPTPMPVMLVEDRWGPWRTSAYFFSEYLEGTDVYARLHAENAADLDVEALALQFRDLFQRLGAAGISHRDCKISNYIVTPAGPAVIDLDGMRWHCGRRAARRALRQDCERFCRNWSDLPEVERTFRAALDDLIR